MSERSFEILLYDLTARTVLCIMEVNNWTENYAFEKFTQSVVYSYLEREETKVWHYSSLMLTQLFNDECEGKLVFPEV